MPHIANITERETRRQRAIAALDLIDTPAQREFHALASLAARLLDCPVGLITLIDNDRLWVKAGFGIEIKDMRRDESFCTRTIEDAAPMLVDDATEDDRFAHLELVKQGDVRAYAGIPISSRDPVSGERVPVGAVCGIDTARRAFSHHQCVMLDHLQSIAEALLESRALKTQALEDAETLRRHDRTFRQAERLAEMGSWRLCLEDKSLEWSEGVFRIHEMEPGAEPDLAAALECFPQHVRGEVTAFLDKTIATGEAFDLETDFITRRGRPRRVRAMGELEMRDGVPHALVGVFQDITERHAIEQQLRRSATVDTLTGIANRAAFNARLEVAIEGARRKGTPLTLAMIDLDRFKPINDTYGHLTGDDMLRAFGRRIDRAARGGFAARLGGDEFGLILEGEAAGRAEQVIAELLLSLRKPVETSAATLHTSGTIGYVRFTPEVETTRELVHRADSALYQAKRTERGTAQIWGRMRAVDRRANAA